MSEKKRPPPLAPTSPFEQPEEPKKKRGNPAFHKGMKPLNPTGRPKGSENKYTMLAREVMSAKAPEIVNKVIEKALEGDPHALKMCMDRILPVHKAIDPNRVKNDAQVIINVASLDSIQQSIDVTPDDDLVEVEEKDDDEVIVNVAEE